jgi:hypothetical protein
MVTLLTLGSVCGPAWAAAQLSSESLPQVLNAALAYRSVAPGSFLSRSLDGIHAPRVIWILATLRM